MNEEPHNLADNEKAAQSLRPDPVAVETGSQALEGGASAGATDPAAQATIESAAADSAADGADNFVADAPEAGDVAETGSGQVASEAGSADTDDVSGESGLTAETAETAEPITMDWYILKVQSNRERSIAEALQRKIAIEGLDQHFGQVIVPTEKVTEFKGGKKKIVERKLWPGYIVVNMHINDDTWFAVRETSGIGDFTGAAGKPTPMQAHEVARVVQTEETDTEEAPKLAIKFKEGDKVKVKEGNFESFEGEVGTIDGASGRVTVMINIFGRSTPVELEYWQVESV